MTEPMAEALQQASVPFRKLLYRFFFFGWLFKDASKGNLWERSSALQHNKEQARWLPTYMRRVTVTAMGIFAMALLCELVLLSPVLSALFYVPSIMAVPYNAVAVLAWLFLSHQGG